MDDVTVRTGALAGTAMGLFITAVEQTAPDAWDRPSNLDGWSVRELVGHATGSAAKVVALVRNEGIWNRPSEPADWICPDPAARLREYETKLRDALPGADLNAPRTSPGGDVPLHRALSFPVADLAMHSWDLHRSQGRLVELPAEVLAFCRALTESVPEEMLRRPGGFGPARPAPADATETSRLMAYLGRSVDA